MQLQVQSQGSQQPSSSQQPLQQQTSLQTVQSARDNNGSENSSGDASNIVKQPPVTSQILIPGPPNSQNMQNQSPSSRRQSEGAFFGSGKDAESKMRVSGGVDKQSSLDESNLMFENDPFRNDPRSPSKRGAHAPSTTPIVFQGVKPDTGRPKGTAGKFDSRRSIMSNMILPRRQPQKRTMIQTAKRPPARRNQVLSQQDLPLTDLVAHVKDQTLLKNGFDFLRKTSRQSLESARGANKLNFDAPLRGSNRELSLGESREENKSDTDSFILNGQDSLRAQQQPPQPESRNPNRPSLTITQIQNLLEDFEANITSQLARQHPPHRGTVIAPAATVYQNNVMRTNSLRSPLSTIGNPKPEQNTSMLLALDDLFLPYIDCIGEFPHYFPEYNSKVVLRKFKIYQFKNLSESKQRMQFGSTTYHKEHPRKSSETEPPRNADLAESKD